MSNQTPWVTFNPITQCYETGDGTFVAAEVIENIVCLADVLRVATMREAQRSKPITKDEA